MKYLTVLLAILFSVTLISCQDDSTSEDSVEDTDTDTYDQIKVVIPNQVDSDDNYVPIDFNELVVRLETNEEQKCIDAETPYDTCNKNNIISFTGESTFTGESCNFTFTTTECEHGCFKNESGDDRCLDICDDAKCTTAHYNRCVVLEGKDILMINTSKCKEDYNESRYMEFYSTYPQTEYYINMYVLEMECGIANYGSEHCENGCQEVTNGDDYCL